MDLTNEKKYIKNLFENKEKLVEARNILKESYNIDSEIKNDITLSIKQGNLSAFECSQLKNKLYESLDKINAFIVLDFSKG